MTILPGARYSDRAVPSRRAWLAWEPDQGLGPPARRVTLEERPIRGERHARSPLALRLVRRWRQGQQEGDGVQDEKLGILSANALVLHQVEHVLVPGHQVIRVRSEGEIEIRLVIEVARERVGGGNVVEFFSHLVDAA